MTDVVIDASLAVKLIFNEEHSDEAKALTRSWADSEIVPIAPHLFPFEIANAIHKRVARGETNLRTAAGLFRAVMAYVFELRAGPYLHERAIQLASQLNQGAVYDAHYLALAEALNCELWTADRRFTRAVQQVSENVHWIGEFTGGD